jgi:hypothetical protein
VENAWVFVCGLPCCLVGMLAAIYIAAMPARHTGSHD